MKKRILTKQMKKEVIDLVKKFIKTEHPEYDDAKMVKEFKEDVQIKMQVFINKLEYPLDYKKSEIIKEFCEKFNLRDSTYLWYRENLINFDIDEEEEINPKQITTATYSTEIPYRTFNDFYNKFNPDVFLPEKQDTYEFKIIMECYNELKGDNIYFDPSYKEVYSKAYYKLFLGDFILKYKETKKEYRKILKNFENIVNSVRYVVDLLDVIDIDEVKVYINEVLKKDNTSLCCVTQDTIDFVKNFISQSKKE